MKIYQKIGFVILSKHAKNRIQIPSSFFFMDPVSTQTHVATLVPDGKIAYKLYRGVGVVGCTGRPRWPPYSVPDGLLSRDAYWQTPEGCSTDRSPAPSPEKISGDFSGELFRCIFRLFSASRSRRKMEIWDPKDGGIWKIKIRKIVILVPRRMGVIVGTWILLGLTQVADYAEFS